MMTDRQLIEKFLELQEHSEHVTDEQWVQALNDPEMHELLEQMAFAKRAFRNEELQSEEPDVEREWEKFIADEISVDSAVKDVLLHIASILTFATVRRELSLAL